MQEKKVLILEKYQVFNLLVDEESLVVNVVGEVEDQVVRFNLNPMPATDSVWLLKEIMSKNGRLSQPKWNMTSSKWKKSSPKVEDNPTQNGRHHSQWSKVAIKFSVVAEGNNV